MYINLENILNKKGLTKYWLSKQTGISYPTISKLCNNETISANFETIEKICICLNCSVNDLLIIESK